MRGSITGSVSRERNLLQGLDLFRGRFLLARWADAASLRLGDPPGRSLKAAFAHDALAEPIVTPAEENDIVALHCEYA
jgi:hypothetical protein